MAAMLLDASSVPPIPIIENHEGDNHLERFNIKGKYPSCQPAIKDTKNVQTPAIAFAMTDMINTRYCFQSQGKDGLADLNPTILASCAHSAFGSPSINGIFAFLTEYGTTTKACYPRAGPFNCPMNGECQYNNVTFKAYQCEEDSKKPLLNGHDIKNEILLNGAVPTMMYVYEDFYYYSDGVYRHTTGDLKGAHIVNIVGWGMTKPEGIKYWIMQNAWGEDWGEDGFFRIEEGQCGVDTSAFTCSAKTSSEDLFLA